ncbi:MAG: hypothetical protein QUS11_04445 [Candidatus Fermentibacter sp.]|nr:hypothetical protein [Candidatus Fermentibacter sp.]
MGSIAALILAAAVTYASHGGVMLEHPLPIPGTDDALSYDDNSAHWLTWGGLYRGVWFNTGDFGSYSFDWAADNTEFWFFHSSSRPWDTGSFYAEVYNGDVSAPVTQLNQTSVTATHYAAVYANYSSPLICEDQFWVLVNTEMSGGGWPSILGDNTYTTDHSFFNDDFVVWEPWGMGDYFVRTDGWPWSGGLAGATWAEMKTLFD